MPRQGYAVFASTVKAPIGADYSPTLEIGACKPRVSWHFPALDIPFHADLQQAPGPEMVQSPRSWFEDLKTAGRGRKLAIPCKGWEDAPESIRWLDPDGNWRGGVTLKLKLNLSPDANIFAQVIRMV